MNWFFYCILSKNTLFIVKGYKLMSITFDDLGDDVVEIIIGYVKHYNSLALLKMTCVRNNNHISRYSIAKRMLLTDLDYLVFAHCEYLRYML